MAIYDFKNLGLKIPVSAVRFCPSAPANRKKGTGNQFGILLFFTHGEPFDSLNPVLEVPAPLPY
jgi:hypothetical protein